jgi:hypothetical protein
MEDGHTQAENVSLELVEGGFIFAGFGVKIVQLFRSDGAFLSVVGDQHLKVGIFQLVGETVIGDLDETLRSNEYVHGSDVTVENLVFL